MMKRTVLYAALALVVVIVGAAVAWKLLPGKTTVVEYPMSVPTDIPTAVAAGPDGSVWFTIDFGEGLGLIKDGKLQKVPKAGVASSRSAWASMPTASPGSRT